MAIIVLDPGHGGTTTLGGSSPNNAVGPTGLLEKTVTLDVALRAEKLLSAAGHTVSLTRRTDDNLGLSARAGVAKTAKAAAFVSIHLNGFSTPAQGTETLLDTDHSSASDALAHAVQKQMLVATGLKDRGVKAQGLGVLKRVSHWSGTACCLVEISFMHMAPEETRLKTTAYRDAIAKALSDGVRAYLAAGAQESVMPSVERFEDGFSALRASQGVAAASMSVHHLPGKKAAASGKAKSRGRSRGANSFDRNEFAIVEIGYGFDPDRLETVQESAGRFDMPKFEAFVEKLKLRHFGVAELLFLGASNQSGACANSNSYPEEKLWENIAHTAQMLDEIRDRLGAPCRVLSAYRAKAYNSCIGGETNSLHMKFNAIDFKCSSGTSADWHKVAKAVRASDARFKGGIGKYNTFIHVDTRGYTADW